MKDKYIEFRDLEGKYSILSINKFPNTYRVRVNDLVEDFTPKLNKGIGMGKYFVKHELDFTDEIFTLFQNSIKIISVTL